MSARKFRTDLVRLRPVERLPDGRVRVDAHLTRCGIFEYRNPDGSIRRELREPAEVFKPESMKSFAVVPFTDDHPPEMLTASNAMRYAKGATGDTIVRDDDHLRCTIGVFDESMIRKMEAGKLQISCGYTCDLDEKPGQHPLWGSYHARQYNIVGNHVAGVNDGRAGTATVRMDGVDLDAAWMVHRDGWEEDDHPRAPDGKFGAGGASGEAAKATVAANAAKPTQRGEAHARAATMHTAAATAHRAEGNEAAAKVHEGLAESHAASASRFAATTAPRSAASGGAAGSAKLSSDEKALLRAMATTPKQRGSDSKVLTKLGLSAEQGVKLAHGVRQKLGLSPTGDLRAHAKSLHASGKLGRARGDVAETLACSHTVYRQDALLSIDLGTALASAHARGTLVAMAKSAKRGARRDVNASAPDPDPEDLASRNAANPDREDDDEAEVAPPEPTDRPQTRTEPPDGNGEEDCYDTASMYDGDGALKPEAAGRVAASSFALPGKQRLPIHEPNAVKQSMRDFGAAEFDSADEKHAAFNRIASKASQFGIGTTKFARAHAGTLDRKDTQDMIDQQTKAQAEKAVKRTRQRDEARQRADKAEKDLGAAQGQVASLTKDLEAERAKTGARTDAAENEFSGRVVAKVELIGRALGLIGAKKFDAATIAPYAKMTDKDIKIAVITAVDKTDGAVLKGKHDEYVNALFEGAAARADAAATAAGANAIAAARAAGTPQMLPVQGGQPVAAPVQHADAADDDESAAAARMRARSAGLASQPGRMTKASVLASNGAQ